MLANPAKSRLPAPNRFAWLMALYAENHLRLKRVFDVERLGVGRYVSSVGDGLDVHLEVIEVHAYTVEIRLTYGLVDPATGQPDPSAWLRLYRDARQVEATHCYVGRRWQDVIGLRPQLHELVGHRLRMNSFLSKWLEYLGEQGHSRFTLRPLDAGGADEAEALDVVAG